MTTHHDNNPVGTAVCPSVLEDAVVSVLSVWRNIWTALLSHIAGHMMAPLWCVGSISIIPLFHIYPLRGNTALQCGTPLVCHQSQAAATKNECVMLWPLVFDNGPLLPWPPSTPSFWSRIPTGGNSWNSPWNSPSGWCRSPWRHLPAH